MTENKWYFSLWFLVIAIFLFGPLAIPLVWINPRLGRGLKITIIVIIVVMFAWFLYLSAEIVKAVLSEITELQKVMR